MESRRRREEVLPLVSTISALMEVYISQAFLYCTRMPHSSRCPLSRTSKVNLVVLRLLAGGAISETVWCSVKLDRGLMTSDLFNHSWAYVKPLQGMPLACSTPPLEGVYTAKHLLHSKGDAAFSTALRWLEFKNTFLILPRARNGSIEVAIGPFIATANGSLFC